MPSEHPCPSHSLHNRPSEHHTWHQALDNCHRNRTPHVLVSIIGTAGSAPRGCGSKMVITADAAYDTIGGGGLEHRLIEKARLLLQDAPTGDSAHTHIENFSLGASFGQCCGGSVTVLFECFAFAAQRIVLFGAGHVAQALVGILAQLPCRVDWFDNREDILPQSEHPRIRCRRYHEDDAAATMQAYGQGAYILIMTHRHDLDYTLIEAALALPAPAAFIGCIGSATKAKSFTQKLARQGFGSADSKRIHMPVGLPGKGKTPMEVAVAVAAQWLQWRDAQLPDTPRRNEGIGRPALAALSQSAVEKM
ncbi:xanthine dehydrogenase accessory protein XdhC [Uruburuella testudinis]|uniref:Xanthine dehydrogenase accessory protein XdhC n=1 Tax=Uruburuella testudinis TaxID=1282863 RepID=A0ABY4DQB3_9NEIS|nr:xanthine dehydrogenase accessory protein XdhC [Uruburuella testudinis]UOO81226.1 xanthine dehydrogenase accessory protein XdhC [Uruburuella testudinis]